MEETEPKFKKECSRGVCDNPNGDFCTCVQEFLKASKKEAKNPIMSYGKFTGKRLKEIPKSYLVWMYEANKLNGRVKHWVEKNHIKKK